MIAAITSIRIQARYGAYVVISDVWRGTIKLPCREFWAYAATQKVWQQGLKNLLYFDSGFCAYIATQKVCQQWFEGPN